MNQMKGLMLLAWEDCQRDIYRMIWLLIGGMLFLCLFGALIIYGMTYYITLVNNLNSIPVVTLHDAFVLSFLYGLRWAIVWMFQFFIWICLFEYTLSFLRVAYEYDERSWLLVNLPRIWYHEIMEFTSRCFDHPIEFLKHIRTRDLARMESNRYRKEQSRKKLLEEIQKLKNSGILDELDNVNTSLDHVNEPVKR
jgi:hypothetical protein